jgi:hypothetical protein
VPRIVPANSSVVSLMVSFTFISSLVMAINGPHPGARHTSASLRGIDSADIGIARHEQWT